MRVRPAPPGTGATLGTNRSKPQWDLGPRTGRARKPAPCCLDVGMRRPSRTVEMELARIAGAQHGVVARRQLLAAGIHAAAIQRRVVKAALLPEHPGVYRVGHRAPSVEARYLAAVLACGDGALLSGRAA